MVWAAAYRIEYQGKVLWIDPWFSRQSLYTTITKPVQPVKSAIDSYMDRADYIIVGHSHYDHAGDLPYIVPKTNAVVYGSQSTINLLKASDISSRQFQVVTGGDTIEAGPYTITFVHSTHGTLLGKIPADFDIKPNVKPPLRAFEYGRGEVFGLLLEIDGYKIYHKGSAGIDVETEKDVQADMLILGISLRSGTPKFVYHMVKTVSPSIFIPTHYDNIFRSLNKKLQMLPRTKFKQAIEEAYAAKPELQIVTLPLLGEYLLRTEQK